MAKARWFLSARCLRDGAIAGVLTGTMLAVLFYFYDLGRASHFATPTFLFGALTGRGDIEPSFAVVTASTVVHLVAWTGLGVFAAGLIENAVVKRSLWVGAVYGLFTCSLLFYAGLLITGSQIRAAPTWPAVFFGNTLAGVGMFVVLQWLADEGDDAGFARFLRMSSSLKHGITAGLLGGCVVAIWFLIVDLLTRQPFFTPAALGTVLFAGGSGPADVAVTADRVSGYTIMHFTFFVLAGMILDGLTEQVQRFPPLAFGLFILFVVFETLFVTLVAVLGAWVLEALAWWSVLIGNVLAASAMGIYMWKIHPSLADRLGGEALWKD